MLKILISSHGRLASGIKNSVDILLGNSDNIYVFDAYLDERSVQDALDEFFSLNVSDEDQVILLSDIYGGSVNTTMVTYAQKANTTLVSGINLGLVIELAIRKQPLEKQEILDLIEQSRANMRIVEISDDDNETDFF